MVWSDTGQVRVCGADFSPQPPKGPSRLTLLTDVHTIRDNFRAEQDDVSTSCHPRFSTPKNESNASLVDKQQRSFTVRAGVLSV